MSPVARQLDSILAAAVELHGEAARQRFVAEACAGDDHLRQRVEELIENHFRAGSFLETPAPLLMTLLEEPVPEQAGSEIGPYKLLEPIGEGGMGVVFLAEQQLPVRRQVALKVIKPGMGTRQVVARFEAERQALALMDHPNIARVLDAGTTAAGSPYFVMELVRGLPITKYCEEHRLSPRERLNLMICVCQAVQHAHQKGIIHRDLKPSNVLVAEQDGRPVPTVIDFGVAKATGPLLTEQSLSTENGALIGTLEYMSPEQAQLSAMDIDTRSDVYALGVLLYELLTGTTPLERQQVREQPLLESLRLIRDQEPPRPSVRLASLASHAPRSRISLLRGELDWIVMKCLEKDRSQRYETANAIARELERYLADEPVEAGPPSAFYRLRKVAYKHRRLLGTAAAFLCLILVSGAVTLKQAWKLAEIEKEKLRQVEDLSRERIRRIRMVSSALVRARELRDLARARASYLSLWAEAQSMARRAEALLEDRAAEPALAQQVQELLRELEDEGADRWLVARLEEIRWLQAQVVAREDRFFLEQAVPAYRQAFHDYGWPGEAQAAGQSAALLQRRPPAIQVVAIAALDQWLELARLQPHNAREARWLEEVLANLDPDPWRQQLRAVRNQPTAAALKHLAATADVSSQPTQELFLLERALHKAGEREAAITLLQRIQQAFPGDFWTNQNLGMSLLAAQPPQREEAARFLTAAVALRPESPGACLNLGMVLAELGRLDEAITAVRRAAELKLDYVSAHLALASFLRRAGRLREEISALRHAVHIQPERAGTQADLANALWRDGQLDEALAASSWAIALDPILPEAHFNLGNVLQAQGKGTDAIHAFEAAIKLRPTFAEAWCNLGLILERQGQFSQALDALAFGHALGNGRARWHYPSAQWLADCTRLVRLAEREPAILGGDVQPENAQAQNDLAWFCFCKKHYQAAARHWKAAFARDGGLAAEHRWHAACAAACAAAGEGLDARLLDEQERIRWHRQAITWLKEELVAQRPLLGSMIPQERKQAVHRLQGWVREPALRLLCDSSGWPMLLASDREDAHVLWTEIRKHLDQAATDDLPLATR